MITYYEDEQFYYVWKPHGIPTTWGDQYSYLDFIVSKKPQFFVHLTENFSHEEEYGLVNRLDNDTAGLLYFAKTKLVYHTYKGRQEAGDFFKIYMCDLQGKVDIDNTIKKYHQGVEQGIYMEKNGPLLQKRDLTFAGEKMSALNISYPIMHHIHDHRLMVAVATQKDMNKGRDNLHEVNTYIIPLYYDEKTNTTTAYALLHQGIRHQIRVHCAKVGYSLVGDKLYNKYGHLENELHLWSIGLSEACNCKIDV